MRKTVVGLLLAGVFGMPAHAAIVIVSEDNGRRSTQYFEDGNFVLMEADQPAFGIDAEGNCWFIEGGQRVLGKCDEMFESMNGFREQAMAGMSEADRVMMQQMLQANRPQQALKVVKSGSKRIADYPSECHKIGDMREICVSAELLKELEQEMGGSAFMKMQDGFGQSTPGMGVDDPTMQAVMNLSKQGFPMSDMERSPGGIPGMNAAMLQFIPEAQRNEIMQQMGNPDAAGGMQGRKVVRVDKQGAMPKVDLSRYPTVGFEEYIRQMMGQMGGRRHR